MPPRELALLLRMLPSLAATCGCMDLSCLAPSGPGDMQLLCGALVAIPALEELTLPGVDCLAAFQRVPLPRLQRLYVTHDIDRPVGTLAAAAAAGLSQLHQVQHLES